MTGMKLQMRGHGSTGWSNGRSTHDAGELVMDGNTNTSTWTTRLQRMGRYALAVIAGCAFAYVAWEPDASESSDASFVVDYEMGPALSASAPGGPQSKAISNVQSAVAPNADLQSALSRANDVAGEPRDSLATAAALSEESTAGRLSRAPPDADSP